MRPDYFQNFEKQVVYIGKLNLTIFKNGNTERNPDIDRQLRKKSVFKNSQVFLDGPLELFYTKAKKGQFFKTPFELVKLKKKYSEK